MTTIRGGGGPGIKIRVVPFIALQCFTLVIVLVFPILVTWLPTVMLQFR